MEYSWIDVKQALEKLKLDPYYMCMMEEGTVMDHRPWGFNNTVSEAAVQEPHRPPGLVVKSNPALKPVYYRWENGRLQAQEDRRRQEALKYSFIDLYSPLEPYRLIKFFIRHPLDPTGSCSPSLKVFADTTLAEIFDWYLLETYEGPRDIVLPDGNPQMRKDYCLMEIDLASRMLGKRYYYWEVRFSGLRVHDTEWWDGSADNLRRINVASSDRMMGNYRPRESQRMFDPCH